MIEIAPLPITVSSLTSDSAWERAMDRRSAIVARDRPAQVARGQTPGRWSGWCSSHQRSQDTANRSAEEPLILIERLNVLTASASSQHRLLRRCFHRRRRIRRLRGRHLLGAGARDAITRHARLVGWPAGAEVGTLTDHGISGAKLAL